MICIKLAKEKLAAMIDLRKCRRLGAVDMISCVRLLLVGGVSFPFSFLDQQFFVPRAIEII